MEQFKDIPNYAGLYQVSNFGRVKSLPKYRSNKSRILKDNDRAGYRFVYLYKDKNRKAFNIHRLVALAWLPKVDDKLYVNHIDNDRTNNYVENLEWCTQSENTKHAYDLGLIKEGTNNLLAHTRVKKERASLAAKEHLGSKFISYYVDSVGVRPRGYIKFLCDCHRIVNARIDSKLIKNQQCNSCSRKR